MDVIRLPATMESLESFRSFVQEQAERSGVDLKILFKIELVLEELLTNIIKFAYSDGAGEIEVACCLENHTFRLSVQDWGDPFNLLESKAPDVNLDLQERKIGGLGIHLVKQMVDELSYERRESSNFLILRFAL